MFVYLVNYVLAFCDLSEANSFSIQPISLTSSNKELTPIGILLSAISHAQPVGLVMLVGEVLVLEVVAVDAFSSCTVSLSNIPCLYHEPWDNPMKNIPLVVQILATQPFSLFASTKTPEVLCGLGDVIKKFEFDSSDGFALN